MGLNNNYNLSQAKKILLLKDGHKNLPWPCNVVLSVEGIATFDLIFVRAFDTGETTDVEILVGNPLTVVFDICGAIVVALLPG